MINRIFYNFFANGFRPFDITAYIDIRNQLYCINFWSDFWLLLAQAESAIILCLLSKYQQNLTISDYCNTLVNSLRMKTQKQAGCFCLRMIWFLCSLSFPLMSSSNAYWGSALKVRLSSYKSSHKWAETAMRYLVYVCFSSLIGQEIV